MIGVDESRYPEFDVLVAGGGMAGIAAAIAAARTGARTALVDKAGWLGGMGITGATGIHSFFNIYQPQPGLPEGTERRKVVGGIAEEIIQRCRALGGGIGHVRMEKGGDFVSMLTPVEPEVFKYAAARTILDAGARMLLHTVVDDVRADDGHVAGVVVWNKAGRSLIRAKTYVDCTGDGDLAGYGGAEFVGFTAGDPGAYQCGFTFRLANVDLGALVADLEARGLVTQLTHAVKPHTTEPDVVRLGMNLRPFAGEPGAPGGMLSCSLRPREITYCNCINYGPNDGLDPDALTNAETDLRGRMLGVADFFRRTFKGCEGCYAAGPAPEVGQRRGRAIVCDYGITQTDCTEARRFDDEVGIFSFIDNGNYFVKGGGEYGIPYRALLPRGLDNALVAGRMISVDRVAHNSTRNTACCLVQGEGAGAAAGLAALAGIRPRDLDVGRLRDHLRAQGVLLDPVPMPE